MLFRSEIRWLHLTRRYVQDKPYGIRSSDFRFISQRSPRSPDSRYDDSKTIKGTSIRDVSEEGGLPEHLEIPKIPNKPSGYF